MLSVAGAIWRMCMTLVGLLTANYFSPALWTIQPFCGM